MRNPVRRVDFGYFRYFGYRPSSRRSPREVFHMSLRSSQLAMNDRNKSATIIQSTFFERAHFYSEILEFEPEYGFSKNVHH